jgi:hypothetical protein
VQGVAGRRLRAGRFSRRWIQAGRIHGVAGEQLVDRHAFDVHLIPLPVVLRGQTSA